MRFHEEQQQQNTECIDRRITKVSVTKHEKRGQVSDPHVYLMHCMKVA